MTISQFRRHDRDFCGCSICQWVDIFCLPVGNTWWDVQTWFMSSYFCEVLSYISGAKLLVVVRICYFFGKTLERQPDTMWDRKNTETEPVQWPLGFMSIACEAFRQKKCFPSFWWYSGCWQKIAHKLCLQFCKQLNFKFSRGLILLLNRVGTTLSWSDMYINLKIDNREISTLKINSFNYFNNYCWK